MFSVAVLVNGVACKDPKMVQATDFSFSELHLLGNTSNAVGSKVTPVNVAQIPGLNTLGISLARIDYAPWGINPPNTHPRASEILTVVKGSLEVGFITSNPENRLIKKVLKKGDVFVFPVNLIHFQRNVGTGNAVAIAALSSQNPGVITTANAVFGSTPSIPSDILAKAFQLDTKATHRTLQVRRQHYYSSPITGENTLGVSMVRIDYAPWGINPPHTHPRASEILTVLEGTLEVGFVTSNPDNRLITKVLNKGDVFVFPVGLIHFQRNTGNGYAVAIAAFNSQNPGVITIANAVFGSKPDISIDILTKAFQADKNVISQFQAKF
ncbi:hypothetical protein GH714_041238 [Hevea brasiliensis]|uniref:Cupin type-1 domain-containing protein n=1 Tax=Hevea brasiliensis TaxID=3981 RepID=A0A6A6N044_HEVBR|nr:hypothetical protein GH714_041238 [Hevea brasiliensis]